MRECLVEILKRFESVGDFLITKSSKDKELIDEIFSDFLICFSGLKEEKLSYPKEFRDDVKLYLSGEELIVNKFRDIDVKYMMLCDFYDFCYLNKKYKKVR